MKEKDVKVSVVLPAYNAERTLARMVDSLLAQTLADFELLIVDDGSTDGTAALCDAYAARDSRVRVFHQPNGGVSAARQLGVDQARGEYSIHADADDWVEPTMLEEMYAKAKETDADVVIADFYSEDGEKTRYVKQQPTLLENLSVLYDIFQNRVFGALWNKLVRHSLYQIHQLCFFPGINYCEDVLIWVQLLQHEGLRMQYLPKAYYNYAANSQSITRNFTRKTYEMRLAFQQRLEQLLQLPDRCALLHRTAFGVYVEGLMYGVLTKTEIEKGMRIYSDMIREQTSLRWKLGFFLMRFGWGRVARRLICF